MAYESCPACTPRTLAAERKGSDRNPYGPSLPESAKQLLQGDMGVLSRSPPTRGTKRASPNLARLPPRVLPPRQDSEAHKIFNRLRPGPHH